MDTLLEIKNLHVSFSGKENSRIHAVNDLSFSLNHNEVLGIVGESGSGKSVTIKSILRLLGKPPTVVTDGEILYKGQDLFTFNEQEMQEIRGDEISMIFQNPISSFNPVIKMGKQIAESLEFHRPKLSKSQRSEIVLKLLTDVGISHPLKRVAQYPHEFSGGMLQRAMIASSLVCNPTIMIADEPTTGLDVTIQAQIIALIQSLKTEYKMSVIWVTHDLSLLAGFAEKIIVMYAGRIVERGTIEDIYYNSLHPYTQGILASIPTADTNKEKKLECIPGSPSDPANLPKGCAFYDRCSLHLERCKEEFPPEIQISETHGVSCWRCLDISEYPTIN